MDVKVGDFLMHKEIGNPHIFWDVTKVYTDNQGHAMIAVKSKHNASREDYIPLIFFDKYYIKVDETVAKILFGKTDEKKTNKSTKQ